MNEFITFLSENYLLILLLFFGFALTSQQDHIVGLFYGVKYLSPQEAVSYINSGAKVIDSRIQSDFSKERLKGAIHFSSLKAANSELALKDNIILCCYSNDTGITQVKKLKELGYKNLFMITGGYQAWVDEGFPVIRRKK